MAHHWAIGVDVGGTKIAAGLVSIADGTSEGPRAQPTNPARGGAAVLADVLTRVHALIDEGASSGRSPSAVGVGVAELIGPDGRVLSDATIDWRAIDVAGEIERQTRLPAVIEADVRAAARAEARWGAGRDRHCFLYVTVGTGISACLVLDGLPFVGARGLTGTCASSRGLIPDDDGRLSGGPPLEQYAGGPAIAARFAAAGGDATMTAREIVALAASGDQLARTIVGTAGEALGAAIGQMVNVLDPEIVVLGGGLGLAGGLFRESLDRSMRRSIWSELHRDLPLVSAQLGPDAGFIGAALAAVERRSRIG